MAASVHPNDQDGLHHVSHGPVPGSPTLTNPDMILPDYEVPDSPDDYIKSPIGMWNNPAMAHLDFQFSSHDYAPAPAQPMTPIIYGNGTMLSDIGEVTEVESTVGSYRRSSSRQSTNTIDVEIYKSTTAIVNRAQQRRAKGGECRRSSSADSASTVTTQGRKANMVDFDDSVSVEDTSFQGDDEESMASSYVEGTVSQGLHPGTMRRTRDVGEERYSTSYISERAEQILANAKLRLTAMEGNLTRARSSLACSSTSNASTPSPQLGRPASSLNKSGAKSSTSHTRIKSEDGTRDVAKLTGFPLRSASALGSAGGYRQPLSLSKRYDSTSQKSKKMNNQPIDTNLEPLSEDDTYDKLDTSDSIRNSGHTSGFLTPTYGSFPDRPLSRSASVAQMRDIQDQVQGLRGKISSLREQARVDSLKRRSLQSLRTPSPFTHSRWDPGFSEAHENRESSEEDIRVSPSYSSGEPSPLHGSHRHKPAGSTATMDQTRKSSGTSSLGEGVLLDHTTTNSQTNDTTKANTTSQVVFEPPVNEDDDDDLRTDNADIVDYATEEENGEEEEKREIAAADSISVDGQDDTPDWESESGDSTYHDSFQDQVSHEDREDAFDYENFFLHSAMGSMSRQKARRSDSFGSYTSEESVETTRGPIPNSSKKRRSYETIASEDSFATADEGRRSRNSEFEGDAEDEEGDVTITYERTYEETPALKPRHRNTASEDIRYGDQKRQQHNPVIHRSNSANPVSRLQRPPHSSFDLSGTNRSFPLTNKTSLNGGIVTPGDSPDPILVQVSESLMSDTASICDKDSGQGQSSTRIQNISKEDQIVVERLVASLGKCVLGLSEESRASGDIRLYRRRIEAARRILEGYDEAA